MWKIDESGEIIVLEQSGCPWKDHLFSIEEDMKLEPKIKFVLYTDHSGNWRIQCVPLVLGKFDNRLSLPSDWCGLRDDELSRKSGISDCIFVHMNGFIGGNKNYQGALEMARKSLKKRDECLPENGQGEKIL